MDTDLHSDHLELVLVVTPLPTLPFRSQRRILGLSSCRAIGMA